MNNKISNIIDEINSQVDQIINLEIKEDLSKTHYEMGSSKEFLMSIAEFVHFLFSNEETSSIISNIVDSHAQIEKSTRVIDLNLKIRIAYNEAAKSIQALPNWKIFCDSEEGLHEYSNPFSHEYGRGKLLKSSDFIRDLEAHDEFNGDTIEKVKAIKDILADEMYSLNGILDKYLRVNINDTDLVNEITKSCFSVVNLALRELEEIFNFNPQYSGFFSIDELLSIYRYSHPNANSVSVTNRLYLHFMMINHKGLTKDYAIKIKKNIKKVSRIIKTKLNLLPMKQLVVNRFKTYVELYRKEDYLKEASSASSPEKVFQKYWEEFCFQSGYYPISEAQLESGRIDTLVNSQNESFLTEIKQIGIRSNKTIGKAVVSAIVQAESYRSKLEGYPNLDKDVYIIVFSNNPIIVDLNQVEIAGILFHLVLINLTDQQESRRKFSTISINELIN